MTQDVTYSPLPCWATSSRSETLSKPERRATSSVISLRLPDDAALRLRETLRTGPIGYAGVFVAFLGFGMVVPWVFSAILAAVHPGLVYG